MIKMNEPLHQAAILTAAGSSTRMGGIKKEYRTLSPDLSETITVLSQTLYQFLSSNFFSVIIITLPENHEQLVKEILSKDERIASLFSDTSIFFVQGSLTRQASVFNGLKFLARYETENNTFFQNVLIHDAARPWISLSIISAVLEKTQIQGAAVPVIAPSDTLKEVDANGKITRHLHRDATFCVQTPQGFNFKAILQAHQLAESDGNTYTDDTEIWAQYIGDVYTIPGSIENKKITWPGDI